MEQNKFSVTEKNYDNLQSFFGCELLQLHDMDCDSFVLSLKTDNSVKEMKFYIGKKFFFDFVNLKNNHHLCRVPEKCYWKSPKRNIRHNNND